MVTYEYKCTICQHQFEHRKSIKDKHLEICPACNQFSLETVIAGGIHASVERDVTTLGQQAEKNSKKLGKYKVEELDSQKTDWNRDEKYEKQKKIEKIIAGGKDKIDKYILTGK